MANAWTTLDAEHGIWLHEYGIPIGVKSNCLVVRIADRQLMVVSPAFDADDAMFAELEAHGSVVALVAPNTGHDMGQAAWQARYPSARCFAPSAAIAKLAKANPKLRPFEPLQALATLLPEHVQVDEPPGMKPGGAHVRVQRKSGWLFYFDELVGNMAELQGPLPFRLAFKWTGSAPGFKLNRLFRMVFVSDKVAARKHVLDALGKCDVNLFVPGHGSAIERPGLTAELTALVQNL